MFEEMNARLVAIQEELRKREKYQAQLAEYNRELAATKETLSLLKAQFEAEKKDVYKLEHISLANLFATIAGNKEEKLSKEKQEMLVAQHRLQTQEKTKLEIEGSIQVLLNQLQTLKDAQNEYRQLLRQKEEMIKRSTSPAAVKVLELSEQEGVLKAYITELDEATVAGKRVEQELADAIQSLEKAQNWGTWDIMGGGTIAGIAKHQHIDRAEGYLRQAQWSMRQFHKELLDLQNTALPEINISGMLKFADFFFDGFIADFMVQGRINKSLDQTRSYHVKVIDILRNLKIQTEEKKEELKVIQNQKRGIVEGLQ